jgi:hypothetical protein
VLVRFRRARGQARQQLKWVAYVGLLALALLFSTLFYNEGGHPVASTAALGVVFWGVYAAIAIAVLRHQLYDIDRLINRTLVYGLVTALLAGVYAVAVLTLGSCSAASVANRRAGSWPVQPLPWPRCSGQLGGASSRPWTGASTGASTTRPGRSKRSAPACASRPTLRR